MTVGAHATLVPDRLAQMLQVLRLPGPLDNET